MQLTTQIAASLQSVPSSHWDRLVPKNNPFLQHAFLAALETSGSVGPPQTGWVPAHVLVYDKAELVGAMPAYEKYDSYGEYIFDWAWAHAAHQAGIAYYPKLVSAIPFTPAAGARLLHARTLSPPQQAQVTAALFKQLFAHGKQRQVSGIHLLFLDAEQCAVAKQHGFAMRLSHQYHWDRRPHWRSFADYLADMRAASRKQIKKERAQAASASLRLSMRPASELSIFDWQAMYRFYRQTVYEKGAQAYLTPAFFTQLAQGMGAQVLVAMAHAGDEPVAGALFLWAGEHLYGRYWGCVAQYNALHFELCYYMAIDWALAHNIQHFEAGAQGEHKLKRGLLPARCHSAHWLGHPGLSSGVGRFLLEERAQLEAHIDALGAHTPFHRVHKDGV